MKTIIVPTDFSLTAYNAATYAVNMAMAVKGEILLFHVFDIPLNYTEIVIPIDTDKMMKEVKESMEELKIALIKNSFPSLIIRTEISMGNFFETLVNTCETSLPYMVIMGCQGTTASERFLFGSHAVNAMKHLKWPLITVPPGFLFKSYKKIGFAFDFSQHPLKIFTDKIKELVTDFKTELHVLNVGKEEDYNPEIIFGSVLLDQIIAPVKPVYHFISYENIEYGIMNFAEINNIDLLIVLPKQHSLFNSILHKSSTKELVLFCPVPVMALHQ